MLKIAEIGNCKGRLRSDEVKIVFSGHPSQHMLRPTYEIK